MAVKSPIRYVFDGDGNIVEFSEFQAADFIGISDGGTGATTALGASQALGLEIGVDVQAYDVNLDEISALTPADSNFIVGNGTEWIVESGSTVRDSLGLGTSDAVQFNTIQTSNLTIGGPSLTLEGATDDSFETTLVVTDPTADNTITFQDASGTVAFLSDVTAQDVDFAGDTGTGAVDLDSQIFTIQGTANEIETSASGQTLTIGLPDDVTIGNSLTVTGNLTVQGSTTSVESNTVTIGDAILELNADETGAPSANAGLTVNRGTSTNVDLLWDEANDRWTVGSYDFVAANFIGDLTGTADVADALSSAVTVELTGDVSGSATFTNAGDTATISATIQPDSVALGTDTTGNYVEDITAGDGLSTTGTASEGQTPTLSVNVDDSSIEINTDTLQVKALGITNGMLAGSIENAKLTNSDITFTDGTTPSDIALGDTVTFTGGTGVTITNTAGNFDFSFDIAEVKADIDEYAQDALNDAFTAGTQTRITVVYDDNANSLSYTVDDDLANYDNTNTAFIDLTDLSVATGSGLTYNSATGEFGTSAIPNAQLENSSVTINANSLSLGGTLTLVTDDIQEDGSPTNLWYTDARVGTYLTANSYATETYVDNAVAAENEISEMNDVTLTSLASGEFLQYNGTAWVNIDLDTDDIDEGSNLFYTTTRANTDIDARVTKSFVDALNVDADTLDGIDSTGFATAAQGTLADSALQSGDNVSELVNDANYIDLTDLSGGTGVTYNNATGQISIGQAVETTSDVQFNNVQVDGTLTSDDITSTTISISGDAIITGDLTVQGTTTTVDSTTVAVGDSMFKFAKDNTTNGLDIGFYGKIVQSSTTKYVGLHWDAGGVNKFKLFDGLTVEPTTTVDTADASYNKATLVADIEGDVTGALTGNADTATSLASAQNFSLTGDVTATAISFDGTGAVALSTSIASGAVEFSMIDGAAVITGTETISSNSTDDTALTTSKAVYDFVTGQGYLTSFTETNDLTAAVTWANVPDANITQSSVTQHQAALAINESQITFTSNFLENLVEDLTPQLGGTLDANGNTIDMGVNVITDTKVGQWDTAYGWGDHSTAGYLTSFTETNDLTTAVTWANVPDANITQSSVTQHEAALSITESQITDLGSYITATSTDTLTNKTINFENNTAIIEFAVTVSNPGAGNKYYLDGELSANIQLIPGVTYRFDQSDASNSTHPLVLSTTSESAGVTSYTTGVTTNGTPGSAGAYTQIVVDGATADKLYYYCSNHSGMGGGIVSIQGSSFVAGTGISISGETISSTITQYADSDVASYLTTNNYATQSYVTTQVNNVIDSAPGALDTLNELAAALGDDANFSTTVTNSIATKLATADFTTTANTWLGTKDTDDLTEGSTNQYYTDAKADARIAAASLGDLSDVTDSATSFGEILRYTGSAWSTSNQLTGISKLNLLSTDAMLASTNKDVVFRVNPTSAATGDFIDLSFQSDGNSTGIVDFARITVDAVNIDDNGGNAEGALKFKVASSAVLDEIAQITKDGILLRDSKTLTFEGATDDAFETTLTVTDPTADRTITLPNETGTVALNASSLITGQSTYSGSVDTTNDFVLLYDASSTSLTKIAVSDLNAASGAGTMTDFTISGDSGSNQTIADSNVLTFTGGTGIDTSIGGTDTVTFAIDNTVITTSSSIGDLSDVDITTSAPTNGQALVWNATNSEFEPGTVASSTNYFQTIAVSGQSDVVPDSTTDTLTFAAGSNITLTTDASTDTVTIAATDTNTQLTQEQVEDFVNGVIVAGANITKTYDDAAGTLTIAATGGAANAFSTLAVAGQSNVVADSETDTLTFTAGTGMTITTDAGTDTITFESQGGGGGSLPVILSGSTSDPITLSDITVAGAIPFTAYDGSTDNIQLGSTQTAVTTFADNDADTSIELERTSDDDTVYIKAGGTDVVTATSSGVTITNLTVTGTTTQANELKVTDTLFELNADGGSLTTDAGMIIERGSTGDNAAFIWDESADAFVVGTTATDGSSATNLTVTEATLKAATQSQSDNSTNVATTAYVDTALGSLSSNSITDADGDTKIQVEESSDEDIIRVDTAGQERLTIDNNVSMSARGGFFTHQLTMNASETFTIASTEGTVAAGPLDIQGTVDVQGSLVVL